LTRSSGRPPVEKIALKLPILFLVVSAIAIPIELRRLGSAPIGFDVEAYDVIENIVGFLPVGIALAELGFLRAAIAAALISMFAETGQLVMMQRDPSPIDVVSNLVGGVLGIAVARRWGIRLPELRLNRWIAASAGILAVFLLLGVRVWSGTGLNRRGITSAGILEAHWEPDPGRRGAVKFDGKKDYIDLGHSSALRFIGSMTISAWINSGSFPADDAAIVSQIQTGSGYQLDTTVDIGTRTIGFKLTNACGGLMARYGRTTMTAGRWYHVAGVYDAEAQRMDVYLDGQPDNGFLLGKVTGTQYTSRDSVYVGKRRGSEEFNFAGAIDDVRVYSFALTRAQIAAEMHGQAVDGPPAPRVSGSAGGNIRDTGPPCRILSDPEDGRIPVVAAAFGVLVVIALFGFWPETGLGVCLAAGLAAGFLLVPVLSSALPAWTRWILMPLVSLAGSASVGISRRSKAVSR
jgi:hypothetical protein